MKHSDILARHYMDQFARFHVPYLNKSRLKCKHIGVVECKGLRCTLPFDLPVRSCSPAIAVDKKTEVGIVEKEFAVQTLNVNRFNILFAGDEVERGVGLVQKSLPLCCLKRNNFEAFRTSDA